MSLSAQDKLRAAKEANILLEACLTKVEKQRDELLAALKGLLGFVGGQVVRPFDDRAIDAACKAIAKVEGPCALT